MSSLKTPKLLPTSVTGPMAVGTSRSVSASRLWTSISMSFVWIPKR